MALCTLVYIAMMAVVAAPAFGTDYVVGDDAGWKLNVNYTAWAQGKEFYAGDRLIFKYTQGSHNVHRVSNAGDFQQCTLGETTTLTSGNDVITLVGSGRKWYACGVSDHCAKGMKLVINIISDLSSSPSPSPSPAPKSSADSTAIKHTGFIWCLGFGLLLHLLCTKSSSPNYK